MPSDAKIEFYHPADYPYLTVCTTSSHGMLSISPNKLYPNYQIQYCRYVNITRLVGRGPKPLPEILQSNFRYPCHAANCYLFYNTPVAGLNGAAPFFCETYVTLAVLNQHLYSDSMLAIFPIQVCIAYSCQGCSNAF